MKNENIAVQSGLNKTSATETQTLNMPDVSEIMSKVKAQIKKIAKGNKEAYNDLYMAIEALYEKMSERHFMGQMDKLMERPVLGEQRFTNLFAEEIEKPYVEILYKSYCDGYNGMDFDDTITLSKSDGSEILLSGKPLSRGRERRINRVMKRSRAGLKELAGKDEKKLNDLTKCVYVMLKDMDTLQQEGESFRKDGKARLSRFEFVC